MLLIPQRLLQEDFVKVLHHGDRCTLLSKTLKEDLYGRKSYVARHAISVVLRGTQHISGEEGFALSVPAGSMAFIPKGLYTVTDLCADGEEFRVFLIYLEDAFWQSVRAEVSRGEPIMKSDIIVSFAPGIREFLNGLDRTSEAMKGPGPLFFEAKVREFLAIVVAEYGEGWLQNQFQVQQIQPRANLKEFMARHFDKPLSIEDYAFLTGRSTSTFRREFKLKFGNSPRKWLIQHRLQKARDMLQKGQGPVQEIAEQVGFNHVSHFIRSFKQAYGFTPGELSDQKLPS